MKNDNHSLRILALLLIGLAAGPEIGIAMEMTALLEVLGAVMFFLSFSVGVRMLVLDLVNAFRDYVCPAFVATLSPPAMLIYAAPRVLFVGAMAFATGAYLLELGSGTLV